MYDLGLRLRELRQKKNMSQVTVAKRLHINNTTVSAYESNTITPSLEVLKDFAYLYNVSSDYLLGIDNRQIICVEGLTQRQIDIINTLLVEFNSKK